MTGPELYEVWIKKYVEDAEEGGELPPDVPAPWERLLAIEKEAWNHAAEAASA